MKPGTFSLNQKYKLSENTLPIFLGGSAIVIGSALLMVPLLRSDFPLNDGGLFYVMVKDLVSNLYRLPNFTSYNDSGIPFVYPPLPIYFTGFLYGFIGIPLVHLLRWLPLLFTILSIPAIGLLSQTILKSKIQSALAMLAFALLLPPFNRLIMGGGLTRAPGLLFSLLALSWIYRLYAEHSRRHVLPSVIFSVLTVLSHGVYVWFVIFSAGVMFAFSKPKRQDVVNSFLVVGGILLFTFPWYASILYQHGLEPWIAAIQSRSSISFIISFGQLLLFNLTHEFSLTILGVMAVFGLVLTLLKRNFFFLVWLVVIFLFERTMPGHLALIPLAMLIGISVDAIVFNNELVSGNYGRRILLITFGYFLVYAFISAYLQPSAEFLSVNTRHAMQWVSKNTGNNSRFLILTSNPWWDDPVSEWFPALTDRKSVNTVQGYEWISGPQFNQRISNYDLLRQCLQSTEPSCLTEWEISTGEDFTHIFAPKSENDSEISVPGEVDTQFLKSLVDSHHYKMVYDDLDIAIFTRR